MLLGSDRTLFTRGSAVHERLQKLGRPLDGLDSIVFSTRKHGIAGAEELGPHMHAYPTNSISRLLYGWDAIRIARRLPRPDIVSAQDPFETGLAAWCIARYFGVPLAVEIHTDFLAPSYVRQSVLNRIRVAIAGFVLARAMGGYAVSERIAKRVHERYGRTPPLSVLPIFVDVRRFSGIAHTPHPRFPTALLWVGRLEPEKDPEQALLALAAVRRAGFDAGLTVVGSGSLLRALTDKARELGIAAQVEFTENSVPDVAPYYAQADLLLVTSRYEGYGMVIVEALAAGVPVLATDVGIAREAGAQISKGAYAKDLIAWFNAPRLRGVLTLYPYADQEEYLSKVRDCYAALMQHAQP